MSRLCFLALVSEGNQEDQERFVKIFREAAKLFLGLKPGFPDLWM